MIFLEMHINYLLVILNIGGLGNQMYSLIRGEDGGKWLLVIYLLSSLKVRMSAKVFFYLISCLSLGGILLEEYYSSRILLVCAFCLSIRLSNFMVNNLKQLFMVETYSAILAANFSVTVCFSIISYSYSMPLMYFKIIAMTTTLQNMFLFSESAFQRTISSEKDEQKQLPNQFVSTLTPFLDFSIYYCIGYGAGVFLNYFSWLKVEKYKKLFILAFLVLAQISAESQIITNGLQLLRGSLVYHYATYTNKFENIFIFGFVILNIFFKKYLMVYLVFGYCAIGFIEWKYFDTEDEKKINLSSRFNESWHSRGFKRSQEIEMEIKKPLLGQKKQTQ